MYLFLIFIFLNIFYYVTALSVHVKITWRDNPKGLQILANKTRNRFKVELTSNKWELPKEGETDKYDTFHFEDVEQNNDENLGKYSLKVYKVLNKNSITEIAYIDNVEDNSLIYIKIEGKNIILYTKILKKDEEYFDTIINLIKRPVRFLQFIFKTDGSKEKIVTIKCKNENDHNKITEIFIPEREKSSKSAYYNSQIVKTKMCPDDLYDFVIDNKNTKAKNYRHIEYKLKCPQSIYENNNINKYEFSILKAKNKKRKPRKTSETKCLLNENKFEINELENDFINLLSENEINAEDKLKKYISQLDLVKKVPDVYLAPLKIEENEHEWQEEKIPAWYINQNKTAQNKGKGKLIESDDVIVNNKTANNNGNYGSYNNYEGLSEIFRDTDGIKNSSKLFEPEPFTESNPSSHTNQNQDAQSKGKGKIIEKSERYKTYVDDMKNFRKIFEIEHSNEYIGKFIKIYWE
uniref:Uncharacterized protein n=1 Tax=Meloidogyne enterolobii TaxID=390850 RepID=A0A6V7UH36_MELEN|nr:unnamed protein product [Meloidogyne enterolobii]